MSTEPEERRRRPWWGLALLMMVAWAIYLISSGPRTGFEGRMKPPSLEAPATPDRADYDWTLTDLDGQKVDFARYRGKTVFLNVWGTWCPPCRMEMPSIANLSRNAQLGDVAFVCVGVDSPPEDVRQFVKDQNLGGPTFLLADDIPPAYRTEGIPATFLIGPDGRIARSAVGAARWDDPEVVDMLKSLAKAEPEPR